MPSNCIFELNRANPIYFGGETITGAIILTTTSDKNVRDISITFFGEGKVKWKEHHSRGGSDNNRRSDSTTKYTSHELYISNSTNVHGDGILPAGTHTYTFNIFLPLECPTSHEGKYGYIRYEISLKINRYYRFDNIFKMPVTIIKNVDLNLNPAYKLPLQCETSKNTCCWPCSQGKILFSLKIPYGAYVCGQQVRYILNISNQSMDDIEGYFIKFVKKITFTATFPRRKQRYLETVLVSKSFGDKFLRLTNHSKEGEFLIPATEPSSEKFGIICVEYVVKVTLGLSSCCSNLKVKLPLVIGTRPIRESLLPNQVVMDNNTQHLSSAPELPEPEDEVGNSTLPPDYNHLEPPTFEEATRSSSPFADSDSDDTNRIVQYSPLYPIYNISSNEK